MGPGPGARFFYCLNQAFNKDDMTEQLPNTRLARETGPAARIAGLAGQYNGEWTDKPGQQQGRANIYGR